MTATVATFKRWTGETTTINFESPGATCWADPAGPGTPVIDRGVNEIDFMVTIEGSDRDVDGVLWDDQRRCDQGGCPCTHQCCDEGPPGCGGSPPDCANCAACSCTTCIDGQNSGALLWSVNGPNTGPYKQGYVYAGLQGAVVQAQILYRFGHDDVWTWGDYGGGLTQGALTPACLQVARTDRGLPASR